MGEDWYFLISTSTDPIDRDEIATYFDLRDYRMFFTRSNDVDEIKEFKRSGYKRSVMFELPDVSKYPDAAWIGRAGSAPVGSLTWKGKTLAGINPIDINGTELYEIHERGANTYVTKAGDNVTSEGKTVSGEYIDEIHSDDYIKYNIEFAVQKLFNRSEKVPFTDQGISQIEAVVRTVLQRATNQGMINIENGIPQYGTSFKRRSEIDPSEIASRTYNGGEFWYVRSGAIHESTIRGHVRISV